MEFGLTSVQNSSCLRNVIGLTLRRRRRSDRHPAVRQISVREHAVNVILRDISLLCALERFHLLKAFSVLLNSFLLISIKEEQLTMKYFWRGLLWGLRRLQLLKQAHDFGQPWGKKYG